MSKFDQLSKKELISIIEEISNTAGDSTKELIDQLTNKILLTKPVRNQTQISNEKPSEGKKKKDNKFDISKYRQRHIAFQVQYDGVKYAGFASQDSEETIESHLFDAFVKLRLIEDRKTCNYSRCGRTDKGVSALGQVVALKVRSAFPLDIPDEQIPKHPCDALTLPQEDKNGNQSTKIIKELDYCTMMNRCLPNEIRVIGWTPVTEEFSSRFSATSRTYRYFFAQKSLSIESMSKACEYLVGKHDFRNFCKLDIANVTNFQREVFYAMIKPVQQADHNNKENIWMLEISGIAFLWHMVRCIMAILFLVGEEKEAPEVVQELLDITTNPAKPSYEFAEDYPLVLHNCGFERLNLVQTPKTLWELTAHYSNIWQEHMIGAMRAKNALNYIQDISLRLVDIQEFQDELYQRSSKTSKRLTERGININNKSKSSEETTIDNHKRKYQEISNIENEQSNDIQSISKEISWKQALQQIETKINQVPQLTYAPYIPLMQRKREESYEERVSNLLGQKKERYERHVQLSSDAVDTTPIFFDKMRKQGSL